VRFLLGDVAKLEGQPWCVLELENARFMEMYLRRVLGHVPSMFRGHAFEMHVPVMSRGLDEFELAEGGSAVYVRSDDTPSLMRLRRILGVSRLATKNDTGRARDLVWVEDAHVVELQKREDAAITESSASIHEGSRVSVVDGRHRDRVGVVHQVSGDSAVVRLKWGGREIALETFTSNLRVVPMQWWHSLLEKE